MQIINFYMCMLQERDDVLFAKYARRRPSYYFNSFFVDKLLQNGAYCYSNVKRWTRKIDVFSMDKVFFPVNIANTHWALAVVWVSRKQIRYFDSMSGAGKGYVEGLRRWLAEERKERKGEVLSLEDWTCGSMRGIPQQQNGFDCGVFATVCADFLSDDLPLEYSQGNMEEFRQKIGAAIIRGSLNYPI